MINSIFFIFKFFLLGPLYKTGQIIQENQAATKTIGKSRRYRFKTQVNQNRTLNHKFCSDQLIRCIFLRVVMVAKKPDFQRFSGKSLKFEDEIFRILATFVLKSCHDKKCIYSLSSIEKEWGHFVKGPHFGHINLILSPAVF